MSWPRRLLRPGLVASVLAHGGLVAAGMWWAGGEPVRTSATVAAFVSEDWSGRADVEEVPPPPETPRAVTPVVAEPIPVEAAVAEEVPADLPAPADPAESHVAEFLHVPVGLRTSRPGADPAPAPAPARHDAPPAPPPEAAAPPQAAQRAGAGPTRGAVRVGNRKPAYPPEALAAGWEGVVRLVVSVGADGTVADVRVEESSGFGLLDDAALRAAWTWRYEPRLVAGSPAPDRLPVRVDFRIRRAP